MKSVLIVVVITIVSLLLTLVFSKLLSSVLDRDSSDKYQDL